MVTFNAITNFIKEKVIPYAILGLIVLVGGTYISLQNDVGFLIDNSVTSNERTFLRLTDETLAVVEHFWYPNLQLLDDHIPAKIKVLVKNNIDKLNYLIGNGVSERENANYYLLRGILASGNSPDQIDDNGVNAIQYFNNYLKIKPYSSRVWTNLGLCYVVSKVDSNYQKALDAYNTALEFEPSYCRARYNKALLKWKMGEINVASSELDSLIKYDKHCPSAFFAKSCLSYANHNIGSANLFLELAIDNGFDDIAWLETTTFYDTEMRASAKYKWAINIIRKRKNLPQRNFSS